MGINAEYGLLSPTVILEFMQLMAINSLCHLLKISMKRVTVGENSKMIWKVIP